MSTNTKAQSLPAGMTGIVLQQIVNKTIDHLKDAGTTLLGNGSIVFSDAASQMSTLLSQFNKIAENNVKKPIYELSETVRNLASQLYSLSHRLDDIITHQQICLVLNSQIVLASVQTITSEIKNGIPLISSDAPRVNYFQFDKHTPSIVPENGGRIKIVGFNLWTSSNLPPIVSIMNDGENKVLVNETLNRSTDNNSFTFVMTSDLIKKFAGQCLQIKIQARKKTWYSSTKKFAVLFLPICIPATYTQQLKLVSHLQYQTTTSLPTRYSYSQLFEFDNGSKDVIPVNDQKCWALNNNQKITSYRFVNQLGQPSPPEKENTTSVSVNVIDNCIHATGTLDGRSTIGGVIGIRNTHWKAYIQPEISEQDITIKSSTDTTNFVKMDNNTTNLCSNVDKSNSEISNNTFWFEIIQTNGTKTTTLYTSNKITGTFMSDNYKGLQIDGVLNPTPVKGKAQICVKITKPQCGF